MCKWWSSSKVRLSRGLAAALVFTLPSAIAYAQGNPNQFGGQDRADAAAQMIVLGVQQGISSLPPTSGQSFAYEYNPELATFVASERLGPTSFRSTQTVGKGRTSFRLATSYFELADSFGPITYQINQDIPDSEDDPLLGFAKFGLKANAKVGLINLGANHGVTDRFELMVNLPLVVVDAQAAQSFTTRPDALDLPPEEAVLSGASTIEGLDAAIASGDLVFRRETFSDLGFNFDEGTNLGLGRISIGAKGVLYSGERAQVAFAPEFFFPSPNQDQFAGSDSPAILPRLVLAAPFSDLLPPAVYRFLPRVIKEAMPPLIYRLVPENVASVVRDGASSFMPDGAARLHVDVGYDYDFDVAELRRFVWNTGVSVPLQRVTVDFGVGGSEFDVPIRWTPGVARGRATDEVPATILTAQGNNKLGDSFIDFLAGIKVRLTERSVLSGAVNVPLNDEGFRAAAVGTAAVEVYF